LSKTEKGNGIASDTQTKRQVEVCYAESCSSVSADDYIFSTPASGMNYAGSGWARVITAIEFQLNAAQFKLYCS